MREVLESALSDAVASRVLFEALEGRPLPRGLPDVRLLVRGPLAERLAARLGDDAAEIVVDDIDAMLTRSAAMGDLEIEVDVDEEATITREMLHAGEAPVPVLVAAANDSLALLLAASLGAARVHAETAQDEAALRKRTFSLGPIFAVVHGADPPHGEPSGLASALAAMPASVVRLLWAADAPAAAPLVTELDRRGIDVVRLVRANGIDPLLDLVRSRHRP